MKKNNFFAGLFINGIFILVSLACVIPLLLIVSASFSEEASLATNGYSLIPKNFSLQAYRYVFKNPWQLLTSYGVTITVTVGGTIGSLFCVGMLAYVISRRDFEFHRFFSFLILFTLLFNGGMVPLYILISRYYHLKNNILVLILPYLVNPWYVFLMRGFFNDVPVELINAAKIDGARESTIFFQIVVPISKPAFATIGLFTAFGYWNDWWLSLMYIDNAKLGSLQYYLYRIMNNIQFLTSAMRSGGPAINLSNLPGETARMALCVLAAGPMLFIFPFFQKYFVRGLTIGAVKG
jgi:putative aldouronate transport system permease protein